MWKEEKTPVNADAPEELYLDHNATSPMRHEAVEAMVPWLGRPANPASVHRAGVRAKQAIDNAREQVAGLIGARPSEIVFTSGATESNNLALRNAPVRLLVVSSIEHPSVLHTAHALAAAGRRTIKIDPDSDGRVPAGPMLAAARGDCALLSLMVANNETGVLNDVASMARAREAGALVHTDATQAAGRLQIDVEDLNVDLLSLSAHKFGGPQGVGVLYVRRGTELEPHAQTGGGQEGDRRGGTLNVAGIVGTGAAAVAATLSLETDAAHTRDLRDRFEQQMLAADLSTVVLGAHAPRLPNTSLLAVPGAPAEAVMAGAPQIAMSHGSACSAGAPGPSHVLRAMRVPDELADSALRVTFGPTNTTGDADVAAAALIASATRVLAHARPHLGGVA
jgi:cysteine desulfurase